MGRLEDQYKSVIHDLVQRTLTLERWRRDVTGDSPLFDIANENTPPTLTANQNDYDPGYYDVLRLAGDTERTITGVSKGKKGRLMQFFNVGAYAITLAYENSSSLAQNRFSFVNNSDFIIPPKGTVFIYYDSSQSRWIGGDNASMFDVVNENTPAVLSANQNDYDIGVYEVIRISASTKVSITGMNGGVRGRFVEFINVGTNRISFPNENTGSLAQNRISTPYQETFQLLQNARARFYYDATNSRWTLADIPNITGAVGKLCEVWNNGNNVSIPSGSDTLLIPTTVLSDEWGYFNGTNGKFSAPADETGSMYVICISGSFDSHATAGRLRQVSAVRNGTAYGIRLGVPSIASIATNITMTAYVQLFTSSYLEVFLRQDSGGNLNFYLNSITFGKVT